MTNQTVTGSGLTGYIVNVMRSPVIERLMIRGSQVALKHVIHHRVTRSQVMKMRRRAIKRWVPCGDMDRRFKIPHLAKVEYGFQTTLRNVYTIAVYSAFSIGPHNTTQYAGLLDTNNIENPWVFAGGGKSGRSPPPPLSKKSFFPLDGGPFLCGTFFSLCMPFFSMWIFVLFYMAIPQRMGSFFCLWGYFFRLASFPYKNFCW